MPNGDGGKPSFLARIGLDLTTIIYLASVGAIIYAQWVVLGKATDENSLKIKDLQHTVYDRPDGLGPTIDNHEWRLKVLENQISGKRSELLAPR